MVRFAFEFVEPSPLSGIRNPLFQISRKETASTEHQGAYCSSTAPAHLSQSHVPGLYVAGAACQSVGYSRNVSPAIVGRLQKAVKCSLSVSSVLHTAHFVETGARPLLRMFR